MVKSPKIRHSRSEREPVTIDLEADAVKHEPAVDDGVREQADSPPHETADAAPEPSSTQADAAADPNRVESPSEDMKGEPGREEAAPSHGVAEEPVGTPAPPPSRNGGGRGLAAGVAGGAIVLLLGAALQYSGIWPPVPASDDGRSQDMQAEFSALRQQVEALSAQGAGPDIDAVQGAIASAVERIEAAEQEVAALRRSIAEGAAGEGPALEALQARLQEIEQNIAGLATDLADPAALQDIGARLGRAEGELAGVVQSIAAAQAAAAENARRLGEFDQRLGQLARTVEEDAGDARLARIVAATALKAAIDRGGTFQAELDAYAAVAADPGPVQELAPHAAAGVPTRAALIAAVPSAASAMVAAAKPLPQDAGVVDRLMASAMSLVSVRPVGSVPGTDAPAVVARMEAAVNGGDYAAAVSEYESLPEAARAAGESFAADLRARLAADRVVDGALTAAIQNR